MAFSEKEQQQINTIVGRFEADTGVEAVAGVIRKADAYPEIPWKGYALGSAIGAILVIAIKFLRPDWSSEWSAGYDAMIVIGLGAVLAALTPFVPALARLFLEEIRAEGEARQYALTLFLEHELFRTAERRALLVLVTRFERRVVIIVDKGLAPNLPAPELERITAYARALLVSRGLVACIDSAFEAIRALLRERGVAAGTARANEIEESIVPEKSV